VALVYQNATEAEGAAGALDPSGPPPTTTAAPVPQSPAEATAKPPSASDAMMAPAGFRKRRPAKKCTRRQALCGLQCELISRTGTAAETSAADTPAPAAVETARDSDLLDATTAVGAAAHAVPGTLPAQEESHSPLKTKKGKKKEGGTGKHKQKRKVCTVVYVANVSVTSEQTRVRGEMAQDKKKDKGKKDKDAKVCPRAGRP
jgi:hypothetical protein